MAEASASTPENQMPASTEDPAVHNVVASCDDAAKTPSHRENSPPTASGGTASQERASNRSKKASSKSKVDLSQKTGSEGSSPSVKTSNLTPNGSARAAQLKKARSARKSPRKSSMLGQMTRDPTPELEAGRSEEASHATDPADETEPDSPIYDVPPHRQGTSMPVPQPENRKDLEWRQLTPCIVPLPSDASIKINGFDTVLILTCASPPHAEPAKVLDCRRHPSGKCYLLVAWWFPRPNVAASLRGFKAYLDKHWPPDAPYEYVLGCQFDVVTSEAVVEKIEEDGRFCKTQVHGGHDHLNYELFSDVPDMEERKKYLKIHSRRKARDELEKKQQELYRMLFPVTKTVVDV